MHKSLGAAWVRPQSAKAEFPSCVNGFGLCMQEGEPIHHFHLPWSENDLLQILEHQNAPHATPPHDRVSRNQMLWRAGHVVCKWFSGNAVVLVLLIERWSEKVKLCLVTRSHTKDAEEVTTTRASVTFRRTSSRQSQTSEFKVSHSLT